MAYFDKWGDNIYCYTLSFDINFESEIVTKDDIVNILINTGFESKCLDDYLINGYFNASSNEFIERVIIEKDFVAIDVDVLTANAVDTYIMDIHDTLDFDTFIEELNGTVQAEITSITGAPSSYDLSFANLFDNEDYAGFGIVRTTEGAYAPNYDYYGLITQYVFEAKISDGVDSEAAAASLEVALLETGFVDNAIFSLFQNYPVGLWNAQTNEFIVVQYTKGALTIQLSVLDYNSAGYIKIKA